MTGQAFQNYFYRTVSSHKWRQRAVFYLILVVDEGCISGRNAKCQQDCGYITDKTDYYGQLKCRFCLIRKDLNFSLEIDLVNGPLSRWAMNYGPWSMIGPSVKISYGI